MNTTLILFALGAAFSTFMGGLFSLKFRDKAHLITSFSAGVVLGLAFFDLLPEALDAAKVYDVHDVLIISSIGFVLYLILDRIFHNQKEKDNHSHDHESHIEHGHRGILRATSLIVHSFLDGIGIGFAFQVSTTLGVLVAVAVLAHDFSDGINTVTAVVKGNFSKKKAMTFLTFDAIAPILGILATMFFTVSESALGLILALFAGFFFYIGASDLIPESYHNHPTKLTTLMTILGMIFILVAVSIAG
jgi:ZIP family zinc transporter